MELKPNIDRSVQGLTECIALFEDAKTRRRVEERVDAFVGLSRAMTRSFNHIFMVTCSRSSPSSSLMSMVLR